MPESIDRVLGRIEGKLEAIGDDITELKEGQAEARASISKLESWRTHATGVAGAVAFIISLVVSFVTSGFTVGR